MFLKIIELFKKEFLIYKFQIFKNVYILKNLKKFLDTKNIYV